MTSPQLPWQEKQKRVTPFSKGKSLIYILNEDIFSISFIWGFFSLKAFPLWFLPIVHNATLQKGHHFILHPVEALTISHSQNHIYTTSQASMT